MEARLGESLRIKSGAFLFAKTFGNFEAVKIPVCHIFWISIKTRLGRASQMRQYIESIQLTDKNGNQPTNFIGNTGFHYPQTIDCSKRKTMVSRGEIGCYASHYLLWQKIAESDFERVLILEDDARFKDSAFDLFGEIEQLPEFDLLWFSDLSCSGLPIVKNPVPGFDNVFSGYGYWLTHAYIITKSAAVKLLDLMKVQKGGLDWQLSQVQKELKTLCVSGNLIYQKKVGSSIEHTRI